MTTAARRFVTDYISTFTAEMGRQPTYEEYAQIMTGYTPDQVPVLSGLNRSFWTAATSSGIVVNSPHPPSCPARHSWNGCSTPTRAATSETGTNVWNTALLIGWDEPGGTYDHVPPGPVPAPDPAAPAGELGFTFNRSGYRVPSIIVSAWVEAGSVYNASTGTPR